MPSALLVIAKTGFQDKEYDGTRKELAAGDIALSVASTEAGECTGKFGGTVDADLALKDVDVSGYDCVAFIGGPGASALRSEPEALRVVRDTVAQKKLLGAICIAPTILAAAGVLQDREATVWDEDGEQSAYLEENGAHYTGQDVTKDGRIITANGPEAAEAFGKALRGELTK